MTSEAELGGEMKVVAFNGSPRKDGNTKFLINRVLEELESNGIRTESCEIGSKSISGCTACGKCAERLDGKCVITNDGVNGWLEKMRNADGIILGSPVYCADVTGQMKSFIDRTCFVNFVNGNFLKRKVGASVVAVRRAGALPAFHTMNSWFTINQMVLVGSSYWNLGYGLTPGEVSQDLEGLQTMSNLGKNMVWLMKSLEASKDTVTAPDTPETIMMNFIR